MTESHPTTWEGDAEAAPQFERVSDVLGPLERIMLAADEEIGSIQQRVESEAGEMSEEVDERVRKAALEQRGRILKIREALTSSATELATRFDAVLKILDQAERHFAIQARIEPEPSQAGNGVGEVRVTVTERQKVTIAHDHGPQPQQPPPAKPATPAPPPPPLFDSSLGTSRAAGGATAEQGDSPALSADHPPGGLGSATG